MKQIKKIKKQGYTNYFLNEYGLPIGQISESRAKELIGEGVEVVE